MTSILFLLAATPIIIPNITFDLGKVPVHEATCADRNPSDDVVVCAPKNMNFWIPDVGRFAAKPVRAEFTGPLNAETAIHVIKQETPRGTSPAAAVTMKWHF